MRLTSDEYVLLEEALLDAFDDVDGVTRMLRRAGIPPGEIAPGALVGVIGEVISYAETRDRVTALVTAARAINPDNVRLMELAAATGAGAAPVTAAVPEAQVLTQTRLQLERMVDPRRGIADLGRFSVRLLEYTRRVCAVELGTAGGTGFLIGPSSVLTNHHVVKKAIDGAFPPEKIVLRFDYKRDRDGIVRDPGTEARLAADWLVHTSPYSSFDLADYVEGTEPAPDELDYAVLRLERPLGAEGTSDDPVGARRGWVEPRAEEHDFPLGSYLMVVQHPCHDPISFDFAFDGVQRVIGDRLRVHHRVNTMPGSSGSPVLDAQQELVALHHAGQPGRDDVWLPCDRQVTAADYNQCIPIATIERDLERHDLGWVFGGEEP